MLDDTSRKMLSIFYTLYRYDSAHIDLDRLARLVGGSKAKVVKAIRALAKAHYIAWDERASIIRVV
jgi:DNA-binding MarR family transcriptional regulator